MAAKAEDPGMWIRLTHSPQGGGHHEGYGEAQSTRNSRLLELADVILSNDAPVKKKASAAVASSSDCMPRQKRA